MPRHRHNKPNQPTDLEKAEKVRSQLQAGGLEVKEVQVWKKNKLSSAVDKLIKPFKADADSYDSYNSLVGFACIAWNASLVEEPVRGKMLDDFLKKMLKRAAPRQARLEMRQFLDELVQRKHRLFPNDTRFIASFELIDRGKDYYLTVASVMPAADK